MYLHAGPSGSKLLTIRIQTRGHIYDLTDFRSDNCQEEQDQISKG
jgi:hypothetical protein